VLGLLGLLQAGFIRGYQGECGVPGDAEQSALVLGVVLGQGGVEVLLPAAFALTLALLNALRHPESSFAST
jgi:hypothetical protein